MKAQYWVILLTILLALSILTTLGVWLYNRIMNRIKNGLVARIHMADNTIMTYRYDTIPTDNKMTIVETDLRGNDSAFVYEIKEECIEKGRWGKYIDYDYHVMTPINPKNRSNTPLMNELKELFKLIGALLDTDLHVKLLRNSKFEDFVRTLLWVLLIFNIIIFGMSATTMVQGFFKGGNDIQKCSLVLDNSTWKAIYIGSHSPPPQAVPTG